MPAVPGAQGATGKWPFGPRWQGWKKPTAPRLAKTQALSHTVRCLDTFLEGEVAGSNKAQAHVPQSSATLQISRISHKYLVIFPNTYVYTCSLQCLNSASLETTVYHQGNSLQFTAFSSYKTLFSG